MQETWLYDPELDLVVVAPDGSLAGCCLAWYDATTGVAGIEPLGVVPEHRGRGLAGMLCLEAAERVRRTGGREMFINTGPRVEYPAPGRAYARAGFETFSRARTYLLRRSEQPWRAAASRLPSPPRPVGPPTILEARFASFNARSHFDDWFSTPSVARYHLSWRSTDRTRRLDNWRGGARSSGMCRPTSIQLCGTLMSIVPWPEIR